MLVLNVHGPGSLALHRSLRLWMGQSSVYTAWRTEKVQFKHGSWFHSCNNTSQWKTGLCSIVIWPISCLSVADFKATRFSWSTWNHLEPLEALSSTIWSLSYFPLIVYTVRRIYRTKSIQPEVSHALRLVPLSQQDCIWLYFYLSSYPGVSWLYAVVFTIFVQQSDHIVFTRGSLHCTIIFLVWWISPNLCRFGNNSKVAVTFSKTTRWTKVVCWILSSAQQKEGWYGSRYSRQ